MDTDFNYPSQRRGEPGPPTPALLDTCLLQHLGYVMDFGEEWLSAGVPETLAHHPPELATELLALGDIVQSFQNGDGPPWAVSRVSRMEFERAPAARQGRLMRTWTDMAYYWEEVATYVPEMAEKAGVIADAEPPVAPGQLQLDLGALTTIPFSAPAFGPFRDEGDRAIILEARRFGFPTILTTDLRSLWRHRTWLYPFGVELWRPSDVLRAWGFRVTPPV